MWSVSTNIRLGFARSGFLMTNQLAILSSCIVIYYSCYITTDERLLLRQWLHFKLINSDNETYFCHILHMIEFKDWRALIWLLWKMVICVKNNKHDELSTVRGCTDIFWLCFYILFSFLMVCQWILAHLSNWKKLTLKKLKNKVHNVYHCYIDDHVEY